MYYGVDECRPVGELGAYLEELRDSKQPLRPRAQ